MKNHLPQSTQSQTKWKGQSWLVVECGVKGYEMGNLKLPLSINITHVLVGCRVISYKTSTHKFIDKGRIVLTNRQEE